MSHSGPTPSEARGDKGIILLVDDESVFRELLQSFLQSRGYTVHTEKNGRTAARWIAAHEVDLVLTDLCMPDSDGLELMMELRQQGAGVPVIVMSGGVHGDVAVVLRAAKLLGARRTLAKPFALEELAVAVEQVLQEART
ncbi:MAG: response regulator [Verrucomicrobiota bacterium]